MRNIRQNLFFAFIYNALGVPIAAGVLYPFSGCCSNPMIAAAAMSFSSRVGDRQRAAAATKPLMAIAIIYRVGRRPCSASVRLSRKSGNRLLSPSG